MIKFENTVTPSAEQWKAVIRGMRNPKNSWDKIDSEIFNSTLQKREIMPGVEAFDYAPCEPYISIGENDHDLMMRLVKGGPVHAKYRRMIPIYVDITAPLLWWKEFDTYKVGTVANSCSTMHKIHAKEFTLDDFSTEKLTKCAMADLKHTIDILNTYRDLFINWNEKDDNTKNALLVGVIDGNEYDKKDAWEQMIYLLPTSYNQKRTVFMNYEVLTNIYESRQGHKLDEWHACLDWIKTLPYSEIITNNK